MKPLAISSLLLMTSVCRAQLMTPRETMTLQPSITLGGVELPKHTEANPSLGINREDEVESNATPSFDDWTRVVTTTLQVTRTSTISTDSWSYPYPTSVDTRTTPEGYSTYTETSWYNTYKASATTIPTTGDYTWGPMPPSPTDNVKHLLGVRYDMNSKAAREDFQTTWFVLVLFAIVTQALLLVFYDLFRDQFKVKDSTIRRIQALGGDITKGMWVVHFILLTFMVIFGIGALPLVIIKFLFKNRKGYKAAFRRFGKETRWLLCCCSPNYRPRDEEIRFPQTGAANVAAVKTTAPKPTNIPPAVSYQNVRDFIPNYSLAAHYGFDYTQEATSFNKIIPLNEVKNLPWYTEEDTPVGSDNACIICLEPYTEDSIVNVLPCHHYYHHCCINGMKCSRALLQTEHDKLDLRCPLCQLSLLRHFLYYKMKGLNIETTPYDPRR